MSRRVNSQSVICHNEYGSSETSTNGWLITDLPYKFIFHACRVSLLAFPSSTSKFSSRAHLLRSTSSPATVTSKDANESFDLDLDASYHSGSLQCRYASRQTVKPIFSLLSLFFIFFTYGNRMFGRTNVSRIQSLISFSSFSNGIQDMLPYLENCVTTKSSHCRREMSCFILFTLVPSIFETGF